MYDLTVIKQNGGAYIDSREVAEAIGKRHHNLLRDINGYIGYMMKSNVIKIDCVDFFLASSYLDEKGETRPCYLISKMGCEMVANKLTGEKGVLFTAAYVAKFNQMEAAERAELEALAALRAPRLGEYNACARIIVRALQNMGATSERIVGFLKGVYEPLGIAVADDDEIDDAPQTYTAKQIAKMHGVYSLTGNLHPQAVSCILNENLFVGDKHKTVVTADYGDHIGVSVRYDEYAAQSVEDWIIENGCPSEIYGFERTYHVLYDFQLKSK
jgi:Rha family phage regulatory protein